MIKNKHNERETELSMIQGFSIKDGDQTCTFQYHNSPKVSSTLILQLVTEVRPLLFDSCLDINDIERIEIVRLFDNCVIEIDQSLQRQGIIPLDLAFTIQDPCGNTAIVLAREVLKLISNREDDSICQSLIHEIQRINKLYPR